RMLKKILIGLAILVLALVLIGFLLPGEIQISRSASIHASAENVFEEINDLKKWQEWQYWNTLDPNMQLTYGEKTAGTGASYSWKGNSQVGEGTITITESIPHKSVASDLAFAGSDPAKALYTIEERGDSVALTMTVDLKLGANPAMRWMGLFMKGHMNSAFDYGLNNIKQRAEAKPRLSADISEVSTPAFSYVGLESAGVDATNSDAVNAQMAKAFTQIADDLNKAKVQITGAAFCIITRWDDATKQMDMICGFPVDEKAKVPARYKIQQVPAGQAVKAVHRGDYATMEATHNAIMQYIEMKTLSMTGAPWESYLTDPMIEKDTAAWVTEIYYPVQ
ncbi:MAG TPA: GyrI-like domain-containing protein, partial [Cyclobacteriaceae bacterium]|nr:GyrI-like domain-containing protein [Cyclobacteriaceae bacterium]